MRLIDTMSSEQIDVLKLKGILSNKPIVPNNLKDWLSQDTKLVKHDTEPDEPEDEGRWSLRDEGRSDGHGESYGERNA